MRKTSAASRLLVEAGSQVQQMRALLECLTGGADHCAAAVSVLDLDRGDGRGAGT